MSVAISRSPSGLPGIVKHAVVQVHPELQHRGVAAEMLVGQEEHLLAPAERPLEHRLGV